MRTITDTVRSLLAEDETAREAARRGILNASAYAREISPQVEEQTWKDVEETSVTVSVTRVTQEQSWPPIKPELIFDKVSVETNLVDITLERTQDIRALLQSVLPVIRQEFPNDLFIETTGQHQITMVMSRRMWSKLQQLITAAPVGIYENQVAITVSFDHKYLSIPNFIYAVLGVFALQSINVTEIFSTMTELVVVVASDDLDRSLTGLKKHMR
jgi:hypothetical protein